MAAFLGPVFISSALSALIHPALGTAAASGNGRWDGAQLHRHCWFLIWDGLLALLPVQVTDE